MLKKKPNTALGADWDEERAAKSGRPVVLEAQDVPYIKLESPEELQQWQDDLFAEYGISLDESQLPGIRAECGCSIDGRVTSDRCDVA
jgi:hypothetical protein